MLLYSSSLPPASLLNFMPPVQLSYSFLLSSLWTSSLPLLWAFHVISYYWPFWSRDRTILTVSSLYFFSYTIETCTEDLCYTTEDLHCIQLHSLVSYFINPWYFGGFSPVIHFRSFLFMSQMSIIIWEMKSTLNYNKVFSVWYICLFFFPFSFSFSYSLAQYGNSTKIIITEKLELIAAPLVITNYWNNL